MGTFTQSGRDASLPANQKSGYSGVKKSLKKKKAIRISKPVHSSDVPVTKAMLDESREELKHEITSSNLEIKALRSDMSSFRHEVNARFENVNARFENVNAKFENVDAKFDKVDAKFDKLDAKLETVLAAVHRVGLLVEEQNARNKFVLDGYTSLNDRLEKVERRDEDTEL